MLSSYKTTRSVLCRINAFCVPSVDKTPFRLIDAIHSRPLSTPRDTTTSVNATITLPVKEETRRINSRAFSQSDLYRMSDRTNRDNLHPFSRIFRKQMTTILITIHWLITFIDQLSLSRRVDARN